MDIGSDMSSDVDSDTDSDPVKILTSDSDSDRDTRFLWTLDTDSDMDSDKVMTSDTDTTSDTRVRSSLLLVLMLALKSFRIFYRIPNESLGVRIESSKFDDSFENGHWV